ncbi:uncharacterized protein JCM6883_001192 [Sporobolomyces salmoneus]|uniref:uncharacterized protein n=1 Tax=Sporobolomyces salmoneus TaxID=183962 RepID=UPI00317A0CC8
MDFICLSFGCSKQYSQEGGGAHWCPRCSNPQVYAVKERNCLEICCIPLVPLGSSHIWMCSICQWQASQKGLAPPPANQQGMPPQGGGYGGGGYGGQAPMGYPQQPMQPH